MTAFNWTEQAAQEWEDLADSWSSRSKNMWDQGSRKDIIPFVKKHLNSGQVICDLGCGDGYSTWKLAQSGFQMTGVDFSEEMIKKAEKLAGQKEITFTKADIANTPFSSQTFDGVLAINSLEWTESPLAVLLEMKRITKQNGIAIVGILGPTAGPRANSYQRLFGEKVICNTMMPWELEQLATEIGWEKVEEFGVYKRGVNTKETELLSNELKQALSFMWVFALKNN